MGYFLRTTGPFPSRHAAKATKDTGKAENIVSFVALSQMRFALTSGRLTGQILHYKPLRVERRQGRTPAHPLRVLKSVDALADEDVDCNPAVLRLALHGFIVRHRVGLSHAGRR